MTPNDLERHLTGHRFTRDDNAFRVVGDLNLNSLKTLPEPTSNARLAAELQAVALTIHMFGLDGLSNMTAGRAYETPEIEQVRP